MPFNTILKSALHSKEITQKELSIRTGITECLISHYMIGDRSPNTKNLYRLCQVLDLDANHVLEEMYLYEEE